MKYLLFEGSANVGKTAAINRFAHNLISNYGYSCIVGVIPGINSKSEFQAVLENKTAKTGKKRIVINSASDYASTINFVKEFCDNNGPYDVLISSCREEKKLYDHFFKVFAISSNDKVFELPMAKISHRNATLKKNGIKWFKEKVDALADFLFQQL